MNMKSLVKIGLILLIIGGIYYEYAMSMLASAHPSHLYEVLYVFLFIIHVKRLDFNYSLGISKYFYNLHNFLL